MSILGTILGGVASVASGGILGVFGSIGSGVVDIFKTKEANKQQLAVIAAQKDLAVAQGAKDSTLEMIKLIGGSYENDKATYVNTPFFSVDGLRGTFRVLICWALFGLACWETYYALTVVVLPADTWAEIATFSVCLCLNLMSTCVSWWFGARQMEKLTIKRK